MPDAVVIDLDTERRRRAEDEPRPLSDLDQLAAAHPALRWVAGDQWWQAHRRQGPSAACGEPGALILAPPGTPLCPVCYPPCPPQDSSR